MRGLVLGTLVWILLAAGSASGQERIPAIDAAELVELSQHAFHYQGTDLRARVKMELVARGGGKRTRVMTMLRLDEEENGNQKYFIYFHEPGDVRGMTFMVWKYPEKEDDRWIFVQAVDLIRRISADDKRSSFVGSDFTYEDISGRDPSSDTHSLVREEKLGERESYVVQSVPRETAEYTKRLTWVDRETSLPLKEEYYDAQGELFRVFTADRIEDIGAQEDGKTVSLPTVTQRTMTNVKTGHRTEVTFESVAYNLGLKDGDFSERRMRRPPRNWIR
jgi:hypothetical protein